MNPYGRPITVMPPIRDAPPVSRARFSRDVRRWIADAADAGACEAAIARHLGVSRWRVRRVLAWNGKLPSQRAGLIYLNGR